MPLGQVPLVSVHASVLSVQTLCTLWHSLSILDQVLSPHRAHHQRAGL